MTTVAQLIEKLLTLPQDAEVECMTEERGQYESSTTFGAVDLDDLYLASYIGEQYKESKLFGRKFVFIRAE